MQFGFGGGGGGGTKEVPKGWKKVPSQSRPGEFSYLNVNTGKRYDKLPVGSFYDDERDTVSKPAWNPFEQEEREADYASSMEAQGFAPDGGDLANTGGVLYLAFVPFLFFALAYIFGNAQPPHPQILEADVARTARDCGSSTHVALVPLCAQAA
eukprot:6716656-Prymnesium_polylepis.1